VIAPRSLCLLCLARFCFVEVLCPFGMVLIDVTSSQLKGNIVVT
jgi:hypothetical protein